MYQALGSISASISFVLPRNYHLHFPDEEARNQRTFMKISDKPGV
jgi:hypothetical protein